MNRIAREPLAAGGVSRYSLVAIVLHWAIAAAIVLQLVLANRMGGPRTPASFAVTQLHKSVGITILVLSLARLAWRLMRRPPPFPPTMARWERTLAAAAHVSLYVVMIGMPITGWLMVSASRNNTPILLYGQMPWPWFPLVHGLGASAKVFWHDLAETAHGLLGKATYGLLGLHVAGALKHQFLSDDEPVLARMAPGARVGRWLEPRLLLILLGVAVIIVGGWYLKPPPPGVSPPAAAAARTGPVTGAR